MLRAIREIQPKWIVGENVLGLVNWNGGLVFREVQTDLEAQGYEVQPVVLAAAGVGAPHRRDRIWFVAYANRYGHDERNGEHEEQSSEGGFDAFSNIDKGDDNGNAADTQSTGFQGQHRERKGCSEHRPDEGIFVGSENKFTTSNPNSIGQWGQGDGIGESEFNGKNCKRDDWANFPTQSPICVRDDGISDRLDSITFPKWRNESIKAAGNAIVPQVVFQIFKAIEQYEQLNTKT